MNLSEKNQHERDKNIIFDEKPHIYYINGSSDNIISVTTFIHEFFPKFNADLIISKMMKSKNWENSKYYGMKKEEIIQEWEDNKNFAANKGTALHKSIELYYNNLNYFNESKEFKHFLNFAKEHEHLIPFRSEWEIYDEDLKLAGSIDMCFLENQENKDEVILFDWKRSKEIKENNQYENGLYPVSHLPNANYWHYSLQLNIYKKILENKYGKKVKEMYLVWLYPTNDNYKKIKVVDLEEEVEELFKIRKEQISNKEKIEIKNTK